MNTAAEARTFASLNVGDVVSFGHMISEDDVARFADLSGDHNPLHAVDSYASEAGFGRRVAHGMFIGALVSQLVGMRLPGKYALLMRESLDFKKPAFIDETLVVTGTIVAKSEATKIIEVAITVTRMDVTIAEGSAHVRVLK